MRADPHRMVEWLGVKSAASEQEILRIVEGRLAAAKLPSLMRLVKRLNLPNVHGAACTWPLLA